MHQRIVTTVRHLRQDLAGHLDKKAIHDVCRQAGHRWRDCLLTPAAIIHWFIIQVLHGNTAVEHVSLLAGRIFTGAAYCLARSNLPLRIYQAVLRALIKALIRDTHTAGLWLGRHRTFLVDGSWFSMPDTPELQAQFGQPGNQKPGCGFPVASMLVLFTPARGYCWALSRLPCEPTRWLTSNFFIQSSNWGMFWSLTGAFARSPIWRYC